MVRIFLYSISGATSSTLSRMVCALPCPPGLENGLHPDLCFCFSRRIDDDWDVFVQRHSSSAEVTLLLASPSIPTSNPSIASLSSLPPSSSGSGPADGASVYSSASYGRGPTRDVRQGTSMHLLTSSESHKGTSVGGKSAKSARSEETAATVKDGKAKSIAPSIPEHKIKFEEFHNQVGPAPSSFSMATPARASSPSLWLNVPLSF